VTESTGSIRVGEGQRRPYGRIVWVRRPAGGPDVAAAAENGMRQVESEL
jgi:hypothetical protein